MLTSYFNKEKQAIKALKCCGNKFIFHSFIFLLAVAMVTIVAIIQGSPAWETL
jgi:hypothetical protein